MKKSTSASRIHKISLTIAIAVFFTMVAALSITGVFSNISFPAIKFEVYFMSFTVYVIVPTVSPAVIGS